MLGCARSRNAQMSRFVSIPDSVEELCESCFSRYSSISRVTFGESSSLKLIGEMAFCGTGLTCFLLGSVSSIGGSSFSECQPEGFCDNNHLFEGFDGLLLSRRQRLCCSCIGELKEVVVAESVEELCEKCFYGCKSLSRVTFDESSSLKLIGKEVFYGSGVVEIHIPDRIQRFLMDRRTALLPLWSS